MTGWYRVKHPGMKALYEKAARLAHCFDHVDYVHIPRVQNAEADRMANYAIDKRCANYVERSR